MTKLSLFTLIFFIFSCEMPAPSTSVGREVAHIKQVSAARPLVVNTIKKGEVKAGQGFFNALRDLGVEHTSSLKVINALRDEVEFSKLKVGDQLMATFEGTELIHFTFSNTPAEKHILNWNKEEKIFNYEFKEEPTQWRYKEIAGDLKKGSTLQADLLSQGLSRVIAAEAINVLLCKINFRLDARMGDHYKILLKERVYKNKVIATKVLYTSYEGVRAGHSEAYFFDDGEKSTYTAHYTEEGEALIRSGLRYPLKRLHIRSGYGRRRHPVTGRVVMHRGVDLRARAGTAVHAVARGIVVTSTYHPLAGNKVGIRHNDGSISLYYHLKQRSVRIGQRVRSHQVIGTVGATGRVTGPHLHFAFKKSNGRWMNPMHKRMIATPKLQGDYMGRLSSQIEKTKNVLTYLKYKDVSRYVIAPVLARNLQLDQMIPKYFTL